MKCDICKKNDAVFYIENIDDSHVSHQGLCMSCMLKATQSQMPSLLSMINPIMNMLPFPHKSFNLDKKKFKCPNCGRSLEEIENTHTVGCKSCYETFKDFILPMMFPSGYTLPYKGSYPRSLQRFSDHRKKISLLKSQLQDYINVEDYENAAKVRDEIKKEKQKFQK